MDDDNGNDNDFRPELYDEYYHPDCNQVASGMIPTVSPITTELHGTLGPLFRVFCIPKQPTGGEWRVCGTDLDGAPQFTHSEHVDLRDAILEADKQNRLVGCKTGPQMTYSLHQDTIPAASPQRLSFCEYIIERLKRMGI